jgi:hypothetical protein
MTDKKIIEKTDEIHQEKEKYFIDENEKTGSRREWVTPSGRSKLVIRYYSTKKGCWNYSRGTVYRVSDGKEMCDVKRNYSHFAHSIINKNDQEWMITGRSYMSQTIVNLDTGEVFEPEGDQYNGQAFCWVGSELSPDENILLIEGCHWACPYEFRFFDFTNPSKGWPELKIYNQQGEKDWLDADEGKKPVFMDDGRVICYQTSQFFLPLGKYENDITLEELEAMTPEMSAAYDDEDNRDIWKIVEDVKITLRRDGDRMIITDKWISEEEQERIKKRKEANRRYNEWKKNFKNTDPLYLAYQRLLEEKKLPAEKYESTGITHKDWCPDFDKEEKRWCRRIIKKDDTNKTLTVDLEWAVETGPIKLRIWKDGNSGEDKFFPHSVEGMEEAFAHAKLLLD